MTIYEIPTTIFIESSTASKAMDILEQAMTTKNHEWSGIYTSCIYTTIRGAKP